MKHQLERIFSFTSIAFMCIPNKSSIMTPLVKTVDEKSQLLLTHCYNIKVYIISKLKTCGVVNKNVSVTTLYYISSQRLRM